MENEQKKDTAVSEESIKEKRVSRYKFDIITGFIVGITVYLKIYPYLFILACLALLCLYIKDKEILFKEYGKDERTQKFNSDVLIVRIAMVNASGIISFILCHILF